MSFSCSFNTENINAWSIFARILFLASSPLCITLGLKSSFLLNAPYASAETEFLPVLFYYALSSIG